MAPRAITYVIAVLLIAWTLASCVSPEEARQADEVKCTTFGLKPATSDFSQCLQRQSLHRRYGYYDRYWSNRYGVWWY
jgi:hypothetical protein